MASISVIRGSKDGSLQADSVPRPELRGDEVLVKITHSGVCGTDEHYRCSNQVLGHEGVGVVEATGPAVQAIKRGDRVGFGYLHESCGHCDQCRTGKETFCPSKTMYGTGDFDKGSFASHAVWREAYLFHIPAGITSEDAAPLQCGGATVFTALKGHGVKATDRVGIIGVGGLGHLAIQMANKMGCEVVVFSGTDSKKQEALDLGAHEFHAVKGLKELKLQRPITRLFVTTSAQPDWSLYVPILAPEAVVFPLSVSQGDFVYPYMPLLINGTTIQGSVVAPRVVHNQMLAFCALHKIRPTIQKFPLTPTGAQQAMDTLKEGKIRYRAVLVNES